MVPLTSRSTLTAQELQAAYLARYDLGPGYPQLEVPPYVHRLYMDSTADDLSLRFPPIWTPERQAHVDASLEFAVRQFLVVKKDAATRVSATFSGSVALDRALSAIQRLARSRGATSVRVLATTPSIDIMGHLLRERTEFIPQFVQASPVGALTKFDHRPLLDALDGTERKTSEYVCVLLSSPENPTGAVWDASSLIKIAERCGKLDGALVVDHCFAVSGVHAEAAVPKLWDLESDISCSWIGIWDTGKTFGLNEDKLGFMFYPSGETEMAVRESVGVIQFGVSRRAKLFFSELLQKAILFDHVGQMRDLCRQNLSYLEAAADKNGEGVKVLRPTAGALALLDISSLGKPDEEVRALLMDHGLGVIAGNVFFHGAWRPECYLRIALGRRSDYFAEAVDRMFELIARKAV